MRGATSRRDVEKGALRVLGLGNVATGVWLIVMPFAFHLPRRYPHQLTFWAILTTGVLVFTLAVLHMLRWSSFRRASRWNLFLGMWLVASPAFIGYTKFLSNGHDVALASVFTGVGVVAVAGLCLAGSQDAPREAQPAGDPTQPSFPVLWSEPVPGHAPRAYSGIARGPDRQVAQAKLPLAWIAVGVLLAAAILLGLSVVLVSWPTAAAGIAVGAGGSVIATRSRVLHDVSLGQTPGGP